MNPSGRSLCASNSDGAVLKRVPYGERVLDIIWPRGLACISIARQYGGQNGERIVIDGKTKVACITGPFLEKGRYLAFQLIT